MIGRSSRWNDATLAPIQPARSVTRARAGPASDTRPVSAVTSASACCGELGEVGLERVVVVRLAERLAAGDPDGDPLRQLPVDGSRHGVSPSGTGGRRPS